jgi:3-dehydroquinate dehydratase-2
MLVVFDIDGTLANIEHRLDYVRSKPKNWKAFDAGIPNDKVNPHVAEVFHSLRDAGHDIVFNPAAFTHYSYALADACKAHTSSGARLIEVHISNPHAREEFRKTSVVSPAATGVIAGFGFDSYLLALRQLTS